MIIRLLNIKRIDCLNWVNYLFLFLLSIVVNSQSVFTCSQADGIMVNNYREEIITSHFLGATPDGSSMRFCTDFFNFNYGGSYVLEYIDVGGSGMDAYPNIIIGGAKINGSWKSANKEITGMPVQISEIPDEMYFEWKATQENAWDNDDKWMSSINFIFDNYGTETSEPITADRDYDLVVMGNSQNFDGDTLEDRPDPIGSNPAFWFFAREFNGDLKPYEIMIEGVTYTYAVRYKFFKNSGDKDNKAHVKFIPYGPNDIPSLFSVNIKDIVAASKAYFMYANLPPEQLALAQNNIALPNAWLKSINAGYEVYTGESVLKIEKFKIILNEALKIETFNQEKEAEIYPNPTTGKFNISVKSMQNPILVIFNAVGQIVYKAFIIGQNKQIDVSDLPTGIYYVHLTYKSQSKQVFKKLIIKK